MNICVNREVDQKEPWWLRLQSRAPVAASSVHFTRRRCRSAPSPRSARSSRSAPTTWEGYVYLTKYPDTRHTPSTPRSGVTVSIAAALCSNVVANWMTTYSPSGAPGNDVA
jgi:hypothetical protein